VPLKNGAKALVDPKEVQVYWSSGYEDVVEIEKFLNGLVVFGAGETKRFDCSTREDVPSLRLYKRYIAELKADLARVLDHQEWKSEITGTLQTAARIRNGRVSNYMTVNRRCYVWKARVTFQKLEKLYDEGVRNGWDCDDSIRGEIARLKKIVDSGGRP
jgi:hypothetical protein